MADKAGAWLVLAALLAPAPGMAQRVLEVPGRDRPLTPELADVYRVGSLDGDDWEVFGQVSDVGFDDGGNLYVFDRQNSRVVVVDPQGRFVREFGQQGEGPGELRNPGRMAVLPDGSVVIADMGHRAYQVFGPDGEYRHAVSMGDGMTIQLGELVTDARGGHIYNVIGRSVVMQVTSVGGAGPEMPAGRPISQVGVAPDGAVSTFYNAWMPPQEPQDAAPAASGGTRVFRLGGGPRIFEPSLHAAALPGGGLAVVDSSGYAVKLVGADGRERARITRGIEPVEVTRRIQDAERERQLAQLESGEGPQMRVVTRGSDGTARAMDPEQMREMQRRMLEERGFYHEIPVVSGLGASRSGTLWVERSRVNPDEDGPIDLVKTDGSYLGTIPAGRLEMPRAFGPDGLVAFIERDQFDVPTIRVRRLPPELR